MQYPAVVTKELGSASSTFLRLLSFKSASQILRTRLWILRGPRAVIKGTSHGLKSMKTKWTRGRIGVEVQKSSSHLRLSPGDIIRCAAFEIGLRFSHEPRGPIVVGWAKGWYPTHYVKTGQGSHADDPARGSAPFLVESIALEEGSGPDDVAPDEFRLSRRVECIRLEDDFSFVRGAERIRFSLNEPMSVARPEESSIEVLGYAKLPIVWKDK